MFKKILLLFGSTLLTLTLIVVIGEIYIRNNPIAYRIQIFRESQGIDIKVDSFGISWSTNEERTWSGCPDDKKGAPTILLAGSSILYGSTTPKEESFSIVMQRLVNTRQDKKSCIINQAIPGFTFQTQLAAAKRLDPAVQADYLIWEIWANGPNHFVAIGDSVYNFGSQDEDFIPDPYGLGSLNTKLIALSRLYERMVIASYKPPPVVLQERIWQDFTAEALPEIVEIANQRNAQPMLVFFPNAHQPFPEQVKDEQFNYQILAKEAEKQNIPTLFLSQTLQEEQRSKYFADQCCHFSTWGVEQVSQVIIDWILSHAEQ